MSDEVLFLGAELLPVLEVLGEVDLISSPKGGQVFFVHFEERVLLDGEEDEALGVLLEEGLLDFCVQEGGTHLNLIMN